MLFDVQLVLIILSFQTDAGAGDGGECSRGSTPIVPIKVIVQGLAQTKHFQRTAITFIYHEEPISKSRINNSSFLTRASDSYSVMVET